MQYLVLTDIHGNLPALEAVLAHPAAAKCSRVLSLGDHTGFGPQPRQVEETLLKLDATILCGNHELRLDHADEPRYAGYNWALMRWSRDQLHGLPTSFPLEARIGPVLMTHGVPGDPNKLLDARDIPDLLAGLPEDVRWYLSGHNHTSWYVAAHGRTACNPGSLGMGEDGVGGIASFAVLAVCGDDVSVTRYTVPYDLNLVRRAYISSGCLEVAPEFCRTALYTMETGQPMTMVKFVRFGLSVADGMAKVIGEQDVWSETARRWWPDSCADYWKSVEVSLP